MKQSIQSPLLIVLFSTSAGGDSRTFPLNKKEILIGRDERVDLYIPDPKISRLHAKIIQQDHSHTIIELNARNGVFVNGQAVSQATLQEGDIITLGQSQLIYIQSEPSIFHIPLVTPKKVHPSLFQSTETLSIADLAEELSSLARKIVLLHWLSYLLQEEDHPEQFFQKVLLCLKEGLEADRGALYLLQEENLHLKASLGASKIPPQKEKKLVLETFSRGTGQLYTEEKEPKILTFPLEVHHKLLGVLYFEAQRHSFDREHSLQFLSIGSRILASHLEKLNLIHRLKSAQKDLKEHAIFGELLACIAHDLKNPLTTALGFLELLGRSLTKENQKKWYKRSLEELERAEKITQSMLRFARDKQVYPKRCDLNALLTHLALRYKEKWGEKYTLELHLSPTPLWVEVDELQIEQVLTNLVENAREAMEEINKEKKIRLESWQDNQWVYIAVLDTGPGIPKELEEKIFQPFFTTKSRGTGLGLSVCKHIIKAHQGQIFLAPPPAGWSTKIVIKLAKLENHELSPGNSNS